MSNAQIKDWRGSCGDPPCECNAYNLWSSRRDRKSFLICIGIVLVMLIRFSHTDFEGHQMLMPVFDRCPRCKHSHALVTQCDLAGKCLKMDDMRKVEISRDIWTRLFEDTKRRLIETGISPEEADEQAAKEVRSSIRNSDHNI
jgi:hypothetical protein